jgi:hypothetical protein
MSDPRLVALIPEPPPAPGTVWRPLTGSPLAWRTSTAWRPGADGPAVRVFAEAALDVLRSHGMHGPPAERRQIPRPVSEFVL